MAPDDRAKLDELAAALDGFSLDRPDPPMGSPVVPAAPPPVVLDPLIVTAPVDTPAEPELSPEPPALAVPASRLQPFPATPPVSATSLPTSSTAMIPWIETKQFTVDLFPNWTKTEGDKEWSLGAVTVDVPEITSRLDQLIASLNEDQWEIKMVVPLDKSLTYHEHQKVVRQGNRREAEAVLGAFGLGWAAGTTASLLVVCQRTEYLEAADYRARIDARNARLADSQRERDRATALEHNNAINAKITAAQKLLDDLRTNGVKVKKSGLFRGEKFVVDEAEFTNRTEAESALRARIGELEADLAALPRQLRSMT
ncbi:hypothetical protein ACJ4V0_03100 [Phreatobacter sp. HK31-P]